ncbi:MAG: PSD1 domain-containing protein [Verrucomicrobiales bacterium]|nr:PSD1 domain-containing protein [Verrucomicrobiales bacterium]
MPLPHRPSAPLLLPILTGLLCAEISDAAPEPVDFARDIQPLLSEHCASCHGGVKKKGGLSLVTRSQAFAPTESGHAALVPGDPAASELIARIATADSDDRMPPEEPLDPESIALLRRWVAEGAVWPEHWSLTPVASAPPAGDAAPSIDRFIRESLDRAGLRPSPEADPRTLLRRLSLDLTGLLPDPAHGATFAADWEKADPAGRQRLYAAEVDELLASPHFGERWGRHWLDEARYADSTGYEKDSTRADAHRYRDWVIRAVNDDMPFDQFTIRQIAGDLLPGASVDDRVATQFHLMGQFNLEGGVDAEEDRTKRVIERVTTLGSVWLAHSVECAQCHNHPYDAISQRDFYALYAFFNNTDDLTTILAGNIPPDADQKIKARAEKWAPIADLIERQVTDKNLATKLQAELTNLQTYDNANGFTRVVSERQTARRPTYLFQRGNFLTPDEKGGDIAPSVPAIWGSVPAPADRLALARWLVDPAHPLTARVTVNKVWLRLFGTPLVATVRDFGMRGQAPAHPALLDWLAHTFVHEARWSRKALIRTIVLSSTYRQSSDLHPDLAGRDPDNRLFARQGRHRVEGEIIRDLFLQTAGLLSRKVGGPSVFPPLPPDVAAISYANNFKWTNSTGEDRYRRGLYTFFKRTAPDPNLIVFDCPDASLTSPERSLSNTPLQALATLQNEVFHEAAQAFAKRLLSQPAADDGARLAAAYSIALGRAPEADEAAALRELLDGARAYYAGKDAEATALIGPHRLASVPLAENAAWIAATRILLNLDEFLTRA